MIRWDVENKRIHVTDRVGSDFTISTSNWTTVSQNSGEIDPFDGLITGFASGLSLPLGTISIRELNTNRHYRIGDFANEFIFSVENPYMIIEKDIEVHIYIKSQVTIRKLLDEKKILVLFNSHSPIRIAIRNQYNYISDPITIPPEPVDLAAAISHTHCSHDTTRPDRSYSVFRRHPPMIQIDNKRKIPSSIRQSTFNSEIEFCVPNTLKSIFTVAPLAYYLQAEIKIEENVSPVLKAPSVNFERKLESGLEFQHDIADILRQVFYLDCLVRNRRDGKSQFLDSFSIDREEVYHTTPAKRLKKYLSVPYDAIKPFLPEWHLSMYVNPTADNIPCLPFILNDMALIYQPETTTLDERDLLKRSLDDFFRANDNQDHSESIASLDTVNPNLHSGSIHGWLAKETPIDAFKALPEAYQNRLDIVSQQRRITSISIILNDDEMVEEHHDVAEIYQAAFRALPVSLSIRRNVTRTELARIFRKPNSLVHYIGHCEDSGLKCRDGYLSTENIEECNTEVVFLNACGSYHEGRELINKGVKAAAVTSTQVLNKQAATVGRSFARLIINGFCIAHAMKLAHRQIMMGKNYLVLGDGTHTLSQNPKNTILTLELEKIDDDYFCINYNVISSRDPGGVHHISIEGEEFRCLSGTSLEFKCGRHKLQTYLGLHEVPVFYNGELYWSDELVERLIFE